LVANDGAGTPTLTDRGRVSASRRVVDEVSGAVFEQEITAYLPANPQFLSPRLLVNIGATAAVVAYDCSGLYVETDFCTKSCLRNHTIPASHPSSRPRRPTRRTQLLKPSLSKAMRFLACYSYIERK
jgi:hypothetical protein